MTATEPLTGAIREHYDQLNLLYRAFWGEHIHHGLFRRPGMSRVEAQIALVEELVAFAEIPDACEVLDVGCGIGGSSLWLAEHRGCRCDGISLSAAQVETANASARRGGFDDRVRFRVEDANDLSSIPDASYDAVWCVECSEHVHDKEALCRAWGRIVRPGGRVALCAWCEADDVSAADREAWIEPIHSGMLLPGMFSAAAYAGALRAAGLENARARDITEDVTETWDRIAKIVERPEVRILVKAATPSVRAFVDSFRAMREAFANGTLRYAMVTAGKPAA